MKQAIDTAPRDGSLVWLSSDEIPGERFLMFWRKGRWMTWLFAPAGKVLGGWDEAASPPTHWEPTQ